MICIICKKEFEGISYFGKERKTCSTDCKIAHRKALWLANNKKYRSLKPVKKRLSPAVLIETGKIYNTWKVIKQVEKVAGWYESSRFYEIQCQNCNLTKTAPSKWIKRKNAKCICQLSGCMFCGNDVSHRGLRAKFCTRTCAEYFHNRINKEYKKDYELNRVRDRARRLNQDHKAKRNLAIRKLFNLGTLLQGENDEKSNHNK